MEKYILALDQGTTSCRAIIYDKKGNPVITSQKEFRQFFPKSGWVEQDAMEIWTTQMNVAQEAILKLNGDYQNIEGIGITNQRETTIVWDKTTGRPVYNAIVWQCRRTADYCQQLKDDGYDKLFKEKTGLVIDSYFSATKLRWILENVNGAREKAEKGELLFGTVETWLIWKMTGGKVHVTDYSNASRTMMFNINNLCWDKEILKILNIPEKMLPEPVPSSKVYGETKKTIFGGPIKIAGAGGDQQCALFGQTCFEEGDVKSTYGTGNFLLMNTGDKPVKSDNGLLTTIAWGISDELKYAVEGSVFVCGAAIQWLRDELQIIGKASASEPAAKSVEDSGGVYFVPSFVGLGAPYWDSGARGTVVGLSRGTSREHFIRATVESMAYQCKDLYDVMKNGAEKKTEEYMGDGGLKVDGGACANNFLMQFQADIIGKRIVRPKVIETTSLGAAYFAGLAVGYWKDKDDIKSNWAVDRVFEPKMNEAEREKLLKGWSRAVKTAQYWSSLEDDRSGERVGLNK